MLATQGRIISVQAALIEGYDSTGEDMPEKDRTNVLSTIAGKFMH
jgi:hypothetical protein